MYLPFPEENTGIIPQDAAYLKLKKIDVGRYKWKTASILKEYSPSNLNEIQVSKQADVLVLFSLLKTGFQRKFWLKTGNITRRGHCMILHFYRLFTVLLHADAEKQKRHIKCSVMP